MTLHIEMFWGRFHHRVSRSQTGKQPQRGRDRIWVYPPLEEVIEEAGLQEVETYVSRRYNTVAQFILTRTIFGPVSCGGEVFGVMGGQVVVGLGRLGLGGDVDG